MHEDLSDNQSVVVSASSFTTAAAGTPNILADSAHWALDNSLSLSGGVLTIPDTAAAFQRATLRVANAVTVTENADYRISVTAGAVTDGGRFRIKVRPYTAAQAGGTQIVILDTNVDGNFVSNGVKSVTYTVPAGYDRLTIQFEQISGNASFKNLTVDAV